ncbi:ArnT family glycosyltransferase [Goodfellowiella coeruleoviolacea]|uniref:4-amino-4-deoxy-L-arabinose transferase n=1 Tax=Goodfellowiella coeruleoviolacea TaxID=334858 RepID=A0AAE3KI85_9PSEU|nr:glycosyltransferase family 39 protein [Goodfellowiella coeruleoviolacea]MCP2169011.1 4-amino-4-deoxy-L-arabinose transferase [Goodfellowiella coeruleoviolacea]
MTTSTASRPRAHRPAHRLQVRATAPPATGRLNRLLVSPVDQPGWARPGLVALLVGTAVLYLWNLSDSGYANGFYAAAAQAGSQSWTALLFGSLDAGNAITVDKPPAALWVMGLSARLFGFSSWSVLAPQALMGVASVALLHATVRRWFGPGAALLAGAALALTPVAVLMFRFDNPDALLVLLLVAGAHCLVRATETASARWLALAGAAIGFGFLTKMLQAFLVLPAFALVYLVAAPTGLGRRVGHLLLAALSVVVSAGWFIALVELWPADSRPYIGGSTTNSLLELALGYNGLGRIFGGAGNGGGGGGMGGGGNAGFGGATGITRLFGTSMGNEISWLLPAALVAVVAGLWFTRRAPRTDRTRAALLLWGGWLLVTGLVFSYMSGTVHPYYTVALAPAVAALAAIGARELWRGRHNRSARAWLAGLIAVTAVWDVVLLGRVDSWLPALRWVVFGAGVLVATTVLVGVDRFRRAATVLVTAALLTGLAGTAGYGLATAAVAHSGSIPMSGPGSGSDAGGPGGGTGGPGGMAGPGGSTDGDTGQGDRDGQSGRGDRGGMAGGPGGGTNAELTALLTATDTTWAAAISGSSAAAELELSTGKSVIALGGWSGTDPAPTLAEFQRYVADGRISYYLSGGMGGGGGRGGPGGGTSSTSEIADWVRQHYTATTVGGQTVYDLTAPTG